VGLAMLTASRATHYCCDVVATVAVVSWKQLISLTLQRTVDPCASARANETANEQVTEPLSPARSQLPPHRPPSKVPAPGRAPSRLRSLHQSLYGRVDIAKLGRELGTRTGGTIGQDRNRTFVPGFCTGPMGRSLLLSLTSYYIQKTCVLPTWVLCFVAKGRLA
jgi:hypothetical protein